MQLCHGYNKKNFPFVIAMDEFHDKVFLVNVNTQKRVQLISLKKLYTWDSI